MKIKLLSLSELLEQLNALFDTDPEFINRPNGDVILTVDNPAWDFNLGRYCELISVFGCERFIRVKLRDIVNLIEYDILFMPWRDGFDFRIWFYGQTSNIDDSSNQTIRSKYLSTEEEYFQESTVQDFRGVTLETIKDLAKLHKRMYNYFNIIPVLIE